MKGLAVITGGSRGIGLATAKQLSIDGYSTILISRDLKRLQLAAESVPNSRFIAHDLHSNMEGLLENIHGIEKKLGLRASVLVNAAGATLDQLLVQTSSVDMSRLLQVNLNAPMLLARGLLKGMMRERNGCIINVASVVGPFVGNSGQSSYGATKAGLVGFTKCLAKEVGRKGIRVNAICPGFIETDMTGSLPETLKDTYLQSIPLGRFGRPEEIAQAIRFLIQADYVNGSTIVIDGGLCA